MKDFRRMTLQQRLKNRADSEPATIGDIKALLNYLVAIDEDYYKREEQLWYAFSRVSGGFEEIKSYCIGRAEFEEFMRERYFPLYLAVMGKKPPLDRTPHG